MKKLYFVLIIIIILLSCKSGKAYIDNEELIIINKALSIAKPEYIIMNILEKPDNTDIIRYKNGGFIDDNDNLYRDKFNFNNNRVYRWNNNMGLYNKLLKGKITLIDDYNKVEKYQ